MMSKKEQTRMRELADAVERMIAKRDDLIIEIEALRYALREARRERDEARAEILSMIPRDVRDPIEAMFANRREHAKRERERDSAIVRAAKTSPGEG